MGVAEDREEVARRYGLDSYAELLDISEALPVLAGEQLRTYLARYPAGSWLLWRDPTQPVIPPPHVGTVDPRCFVARIPEQKQP